MRKIILFAMLFCLSSAGTACISTQDSFDIKKLMLQISKSEGQSSVVYKNIDDSAKVITVLNIFKNVEWDNTKGSLSRPPDYIIETQYTDPTVPYHSISYNAWLSPKKDYFDIAIEGKTKRARLSKKDSNTLLIILEVSKSTRDVPVKSQSPSSPPDGAGNG